MIRFLTLLTGLLFVVLQITLASLISVHSIRPDFIVIFIVTRALIEGPTAGVVWGFGLGFLLDAVSSGLVGLGSMAYSVVGFLAGQVGNGKVVSRFHYVVALISGSVAAHVIFFYFTEPWKEIGLLEPMLFRVLPGILLTGFLGILWMLSPFLRFTAERKRG
ncbi:MAG: rod shape-determining protein MreD [Candidatus Zixiibacteriota bacterium]|nr:MAG: rod shape-determining protein MreD [candidate division Zixibacteria bacterium]